MVQARQRKLDEKKPPPPPVQQPQVQAEGDLSKAPSGPPAHMLPPEGQLPGPPAQSSAAPTPPDTIEVGLHCLGVCCTCEGLLVKPFNPFEYREQVRQWIIVQAF